MFTKGSFTALVLWMCLDGLANAQLFRWGPEIKEISALELHQLIVAEAQRTRQLTATGNAARKPEFVVVDVRDPSEYQVSLIPGAISKAQYESDLRSYAGTTVIPYCTVGGRSAQYAKQLAAKGVKVLNFNESIIGWCNARLPLVTVDGKTTNQVHIYNSRYRVPAEYQAVY